MRAVTWLVRRLKARPDTEHEMSFNRFGIAAVFIAILLAQGRSFTQAPLLVMCTYVAASIALLAHILAFPAAAPRRRFAALVLDTACMSVETYLGGEQVGGFFLIFLWISFGNGLRFGIGALRMSVVVTGAGAAVTLLTTPYWRSQPTLGFGLWCGLVVLPAYAGSLIQRLAKARQEAEEASAAKTLFLANVSHELRTPLTAIMGMGRLLQDTSLDREQQEMTETVQTAARSLLALIDDLLKVSRLDASRDPVIQAKFDVMQVLIQVRQLLLAQAGAKGLTVSVHVAPDVPAEVIGGERQLREILTNLVGNAVKFTEAGGVLVSAAPMRHPDGGQRLRFEVADTGIGIVPHAKAHIFDTFTQADSTIAGRFGGTGLGLAISRRLARLLGGTLEVDSTFGQGSTFKLTLPFSVPAGAPPAHPSNVAACVVAAEGSSRLWSAGGLADLTVSVTEIDAALPADQLVVALRRWHQSIPAPTSPVVILDIGELGCPAEEVRAALARCASIAGPHVILAATDRLPPGVDVRWDCASLLTGPTDRPALASALRIASAQVQASRPAPLAGVGRPLRVLVAEDNPVNQKVLMKLLAKAGHSATLVRDGESALDALEARAGHFDAVLMDVNMPHMDGLEATKLYRFTALGDRHLPVIGLTADATDEMAERCRQAGMDACLTKPFDAARLLATLQDLAPVGGTPGHALEQGTGESFGLTGEHRSEPVFGQAEEEVLDGRVLQGLADLGGEEFVSELVTEFKQEAGRLVGELSAALRRNKTVQVHGHAHTLRGVSYNVGARTLGKLCDDVKRLSDAELGLQGDVLAHRAGAEFARVEAAFRARQPVHR